MSAAERGALIVCIGNALAADDGVGSAVYETLSEQVLPPEVRLVFLGLGGLDLLDVLEGEDLLVVVDAIQLGQPAGSVRLLGWSEIPEMGLRPVSGHGIGIREAVEVGRRLFPERMPGKIVLVGVEGSCFDQLGVPLSPQVAAAVPEAVGAVRQLLINMSLS